MKQNLMNLIHEVNKELVFDDENFERMVEGYAGIKDDYKISALLFLLDGRLEEIYGTEESNMAIQKIIMAINELEGVENGKEKQ